MLPMHFMSPHVLSTQKEPSETTMAFTRQTNINIHIESRRTRFPTTKISIIKSKMHRPRDKFVYELLSEWYVQHQQQFVGSEQYACLQAILRADQKTGRPSTADIVPSCRTEQCIRWTINTLCSCTERCNRRRRTACNCVPNMAMAGYPLCGQIKRDTIVSERKGSSLCLLQSEPLEPSIESVRYDVFFCFFVFIFYLLGTFLVENYPFTFLLLV